MEITAKFNNGEEMMSFARLLLGQDNTVKFVPSHGVVADVDPSKEDDTEKQEDKSKEVNIPKVEAEVVGEDVPPTDTKESEPVEDKKEKPKVTKEMVRAAFSKLIGKQKEAKELTGKYGAAKLPDVKEDDYAAILKEAEELL